MKTIKLLLSLTIVASIFASCQKDNTPDIVINDNSVDNSVSTTTNGGGNGGAGSTGCIELGGTKTADLTLEADQCYILTEALIMATGTTLTIPAGVVIKANLGNAAGSYIAISQGAKIMAVGNADRPIVMTSNSNTQNAGDWGGLILLGKAPINSVAGGDATSTSEIGNLPYGGSNPADNSGVLKYIRIEYSGGAASGSQENNGFSFYGVGNGTVVDHVQSFEGADDGFEFFGGTVNASFVSSVRNQDDSVDWTEGYSGTVTDIYIKHGVDHDKGLEGDGFNSEIGNNSNPVFFSNPTMSNITIIGLGSSSGEAARLRVGTKGTFTNMLIQGFDIAFHIVGDGGASPTGQNVLDGTLHANDVTLNDVNVPVENETTVNFTDDQFLTGVGNGTGTDYASWSAGWVRN